jgi:hypothetical protein
VNWQRTYDRATYARRWYAGADLMPYQLAAGLSLRWFEGRPHLRVYVGPIKLYGGLSRPEPATTQTETEEP